MSNKWARAFDPQVCLSDIPMSCTDWNPDLHDYVGDSGSLGLLEKLQGRIAWNLASVADDEQPSWRAELLPLINNWFLQLCDRPDEFQYLYAEWRKGTGWAVRCENIRPAGREYGIRLHGSDLLALLEGRILLEHITLGGTFRYHSPQRVDDLEQIRRRVFNPFYAVVGSS